MLSQEVLSSKINIRIYLLIANYRLSPSGSEYLFRIVSALLHLAYWRPSIATAIGSMNTYCVVSSFVRSWISLVNRGKYPNIAGQTNISP